MVEKVCDCIKNAQEITREMIHLMEKDESFKEAEFIAGILFTVQESGLADTLKEFDDILEARRKGLNALAEKNMELFTDNLRKYKSAVVIATEKMKDADCKKDM